MTVGASQDFVLGQGFENLGEYVVLLSRDGSRRLLAELSADPDRPEARPQEAYRELLASLTPGWTVRLMTPRSACSTPWQVKTRRRCCSQPASCSLP